MLERRHLSILGARLVKRATPDIALLEGVVAERVLEAMRVASRQLTVLGVRHALVGALGVGAHGYPRATRDVDFLVGSEAFELHESGIVTLRPGVPIQVGGVSIDHLSAKVGEEHLENAISTIPAAEPPGVPIAPVEVIVYLKLRSPRRRDQADVIELVKSGLDVMGCAKYLRDHSPDLVERFEDLVRQAEAEEA